MRATRIGSCTRSRSPDARRPGSGCARCCARTGREYPEFIAAVSILFGLAPDDARTQLEQRAESLAAELADTEAQFESNPGLPRLFLLEEEYRQAVLRAELAWLRGVIADLKDGRLTWSEEWLREIATAFQPPDDDKEEPP